MRNGLESRIEKASLFLRFKLTLYFQKSTTLGFDFAKIKAEVIKLKEKVNELSKNYKQHQDKLNSKLSYVDMNSQN